MSEKLLKSFAIEGNVVVTMVWSSAAKNKVMVIPRKTKTRRIGVKGTLGPKSVNAGATGAVGGSGGGVKTVAASRSVEDDDSGFSETTKSASTTSRLVCTLVE